MVWTVFNQWHHVLKGVVVALCLVESQFGQLAACASECVRNGELAAAEIIQAYLQLYGAVCTNLHVHSETDNSSHPYFSQGPRVRSSRLWQQRQLPLCCQHDLWGLHYTLNSKHSFRPCMPGSLVQAPKDIRSICETGFVPAMDTSVSISFNNLRQ